MSLQPNNNLIIAPTPLRTSGKSVALKGLLKSLQSSKKDVYKVTDAKGTFPLSAFRSRNITIHTIVQSKDQLLSLYASNNWLKMHGYPVRRKMHNSMRRQERKQDHHKRTHPVTVSVVGEEYTFFQVDCKP